MRDNYLQTINNIQLADADVIYKSQLAMNSSIRYIIEILSNSKYCGNVIPVIVAHALALQIIVCLL